MKKLIFLMVGLILFSCSEPCQPCDFKYEVGDDVKIKNKTFHNTAVVTRQIQGENCGCSYEVSYYSTLGTRRHRNVLEVEIEPSTGNAALDEIKELID
jgi:hypothetical protein